MSLILPRMFPLNGRNGVSHGPSSTQVHRFIPVRRWEAAPTWKTSDATSIAMSALISSAVLLPFVVLSPACRHWFVVPVLLCGILIGMDVVDWMRGRMNLFDPVGLLGVLGFLVFFLAPLLHVSLQHGMDGVRPPPDGRVWLGRMGLVNVAGLLVYAVVIRFGGARPRAPMPLWQIRHPGPVLALALLLTAGLQATVYANGSAFAEWGWLLRLSEAFPQLALMAMTMLVWRRKSLSWAALLGMLVVYAGLLVLLGELRGLWGAIAWSMFWGVGVIHFCLRPLGRKAVLAGLAGIVLFMLAYATVKHGGTRDVTKALEGQKTEWTRLAKTGLEHLSLADVQASLLYRSTDAGGDSPRAHGGTYVNAATLLIPESVRPGRPATSPRAGLGGEAMLNFGAAAVTLAYAVFALCVRGVRQFVYRLRRHDGRVFLLPVFLGLCILGLVCNSDDVLHFLLRYGAAVALVLLFTCRPVRTSHRFAGLS